MKKNMAGKADDRTKRQIQIHNELLENLALDYLHPTVRGGVYFDKFKMRTKNYLKSLRHDYDKAQKYFEELASEGYIAVGKYDDLRKLVEGIDVEIIALIDECEKKLRNIDDIPSKKDVRKIGQNCKTAQIRNGSSSEESDGESKERKSKSRGSGEKII